MTRVAIIYYSSGGTVARLAEAVSAGAASAGASVRSVELPATDLEPIDRALAALNWADGLVIGTPACFGNVAAPVKRFIDATWTLWEQEKLADKAVAGFTAAGSDHGGHETTLLALFQSVYHWGGVIVPAGYGDPVVRRVGGNPYGVSAKAHRDGSVDAPALDAARYLGRRVARFAALIRQASVVAPSVSAS
ncbi:NAD(P)H-dependent oxidoreductase [Micromonospora carbonacea]|uniref:Flavodoxin family protein n=1 Tax=Micromonospora carbonacea TaxID=47853 RepID=A0A1C4VEH6_9ACTN|nr:flavodoxin family protein [Micromonospora carbonacea]MBB5825919.1 NAD(P)H dehydrogenase (quinone) [Micromonospora carbonacea]QLD25512.1 flavodoxin family protein [Micromonospora carbonacea]SCE82115.1 NAD(P)H dehydrogenase (quinone) [Micromonospora carbonacea]